MATTSATKPYEEWLKAGFQKPDFGPKNRRRRSPPHVGTPIANREQPVADDTLRPGGNEGPFGFHALQGIANVNLVLQDFQGVKATNLEVGLAVLEALSLGSTL